MERQCLWKRKTMFAGLAAGALLLLAGIAWLERTPLWAWYSVQQLIRSHGTDGQGWEIRVAELDLVAVPRLIDCLRRADEQVCARAQAGLLRMVKSWQPDDSRRATLAGCLAERFTALSGPGRTCALEVQDALLPLRTSAQPPLDLLPALAHTLTEVSRTTDCDVHAKALTLVDHLLERGNLEHGPSSLHGACRELTQRCLGDDLAANRIQAIRLASRPPLRLLEAVVPLLSDPVADVRREAMLAVGPAATVMNTDDLLRWLHDPDAVVRNLCEKALRTRGLGDEHVKLGRLLTDSRPGVRLQVLGRLRQAADLEPGVWLRHLSHDSAPAVRAAAARAASERAVGSLADRLEQMAQNDPCPSVRQLAQYYLSTQKLGLESIPEQ